jgi:hypothetical protein
MVRATAATSVAAAAVAFIQAWPGWAIVAAAVLPWFLPLAFQTRWLTGHYGWFALFYLLVITQTGHYMEHVTQFVQDHFLGFGDQGPGIIGVLNTEWVHFGWNTYVFIATIVLLTKFRRNPWLWALLAGAIWHQVEHVYEIVGYIRTGVAPVGILPRGGLVDLPINGHDLHHLYNTIETVPLIAGFFWQLRRTHDSWLERAFPSVDKDTLLRATADARARRFGPGDVLVRPGQAGSSCLVVVRGELGYYPREGVGVEPDVLGPGQAFVGSELPEPYRSEAAVRARSSGEAIVVDAMPAGRNTDIAMSGSPIG